MEDQIQAVLPHVETTVPSFVYLMRCEQYHKIGYSNDPRKRQMSMQVGCPFDICIVSMFETLTPIWDESYLHELLQPHKYKGEWFRLPPEMRNDLRWFAPNPSPKPNPANCNVQDRMSILIDNYLTEEEVIYCVLGVRPSFGKPYEIAKKEYDNATTAHSFFVKQKQVKTEEKSIDVSTQWIAKSDQVRKLKNAGLTQEQVIEVVFGIKKGGSEKYKSARSFVKEVLGTN